MQSKKQFKTSKISLAWRASSVSDPDPQLAFRLLRHREAAITVPVLKSSHDKLNN
jgi:hypothetical protein